MDEDGVMDPWKRQSELCRTTIGWSILSIGGSLVLSRRDDPWRRAFAQQNLGWGVVDLGIVAVVSALKNRRMRRLADPYAQAEVERERRRLRVILAANAVADAGYCALGIWMWRSRWGSTRPKGSGTGAAILIQGAFLMVHDSFHAIRSSPEGRDIDVR